EFVLRGAGNGDLAGDIPHRSAGHVLAVPAAAPGVFGEAESLRLLHVEEHVEVEAVGIVDVAARVRAGDDDRSHLGGLAGGVQGDIAGAGDSDLASLERHAPGGEHV